MGYLSETKKAGGFDLMAAAQALPGKGGPGLPRQIFDILRLAARGVRYEEYYTYALWRQDRGRAFLKGFNPNHRNRKFNTSLQMPDRGIMTEVIDDKIQTEAILTGLGLPVTRTSALYLSGPGTDLSALPHVRPLHSLAEIAAYLADPASLPVFGKPRADSFARGAAVIEGRTATGDLRFLNGKSAPVAGLAAEIVQDWAQGYMFQPFYQCEAGLRRHVGPAMASLRIVTLLTDRGVELWYAVIRLPAKSAMHDGDAFDTRIWGLVDLSSGKIAKLRNLRDPLTPDVTHCLDPDAPFLGYTLPHWDQAVAICKAGHAAFPGHGIIGWDVFLTEEGALLNEANSSPGHVYQVAAQRPLLNPDMRPAYERAVAFARRHGGGRKTF